MSTNYYIEAEPPCPHCGRAYERMHIGLSSVGWCFQLHIDPANGIKDLDDWKRLWKGKKIVDEYGRSITEEEMLDEITNRLCLPRGERPLTLGKTWDEFHHLNNSMFGPNNLLRSQISDTCIGHGAGTWDLIVGEFC